MTSRIRRLAAFTAALVGVPVGDATRRVRWLWAGAVTGLGLAALIIAGYTVSAVSGSAPGGAFQVGADVDRPGPPPPPATSEAERPYVLQAPDATVEWASVSVAAVSAVGGMMSGVAAVITTRRSRPPAPAPVEQAPSVGLPPQAPPPTASPPRVSCRREPSPRPRPPGRRDRSFRHPDPPR
ncbi:hypothetical protein [Streptomyces sp. NPDC101206]|uniref:hypothetical protein n=1 Tax=Streptomyces sp. NPDC101206 TaxID=3366128 RepID=UPI0038029462